MILDSHFFAFAGVAALLVLSPGATMVVVADAAIEGGRRAALWTVAGIGTANATLALAAAFGLAALVHRMPIVLRMLAIAGAVYLAWLGVRALWRAVRPDAADLKVRAAAGLKPRPTPTLKPRPTPTLKPRPTPTLKPRPTPTLARFGRGLITNYANPSVVLFYAVVVSQFVPAGTAFLPRYLLLGGTHVAMSVVWQGIVGLSVGAFAAAMSRPDVRRVLDLIMAAALIAFAVKIAVS